MISWVLSTTVLAICRLYYRPLDTLTLQAMLARHQGQQAGCRVLRMGITKYRQALYVRAIYCSGDDSNSCNAGDDQWLILASDGLFANEERGGGGGLENQEVVDVCNQNSGLPAEKLAQKLVLMAQEAGSTDDITVVVLKLK